MTTREHKALARRLATVERRLAPRREPPVVDLRVVTARLAQIRGRGDPEAVRRVLEDLPT